MMMNRNQKVGLLGIIILLFQTNTFGQKNEFGLMIGGSNYQGDLAYNLVPKETNLAGGIFTRYNLNKYWSWRNALQYGKVTASDENFEDRRTRNLSFQSHIWELNSVFEFNYLPFGSHVLTKDFSTFVFGGLAAFRFNPRTEYKGNIIELRPLRTEGQNRKDMYSTIQIAVPFGGGVKYSYKKNWVFAFEVGWRKTFTDYIDDVSTTYPNRDEQISRSGLLSAELSDRSWELQEIGEPLSQKGDWRGDPNLKDWYIFSLITVAYRFTPINCWPSYIKSYK
jgi:hypothetical protein